MDYEVYDEYGTYLGDISIDDDSGSTRPLRSDEKEARRLPWKILLLVINVLIIGVLIWKCYETFLQDAPSVIVGLAGAIPMIVTILCATGALVYGIYSIILRQKVFAFLRGGKFGSKLDLSKMNNNVENQSKIAASSFCDLEDEQILQFDETAEEIEKFLRQYHSLKVKSLFLTANRIMRYALMTYMFLFIVVNNIISTDLSFDDSLEIVGPFFAYCYLLGILEFCIKRKEHKLKKLAWLAFPLSFVGGPIVSSLLIALIYYVQLALFHADKLFITFENMELCFILFFMLLTFEIVMILTTKKTNTKDKATNNAEE